MPFPGGCVSLITHLRQTVPTGALGDQHVEQDHAEQSDGHAEVTQRLSRLRKERIGSSSNARSQRRK